MKRFGLLSLALAVCLSAAASAVDMVKAVSIWTCRRVEAVVKVGLFGPTMTTKTPAKEGEVKPPHALRAAGRFVLRLLKRERPEVTPDWRRCPAV